MCMLFKWCVEIRTQSNSVDPFQMHRELFSIRFSSILLLSRARIAIFVSLFIPYDCSPAVAFHSSLAHRSLLCSFSSFSLACSYIHDQCMQYMHWHSFFSICLFNLIQWRCEKTLLKCNLFIQITGNTIRMRQESGVAKREVE